MDGETRPGAAVTDVERELAVILRRARAFSGQFAREFHPQLDAAAYGLLVWLDDQGSARLTDMAAFFGVGKPTVSRQVHLLETLDLIRRSADPQDRRALIIQLTPGGAARLHEVREARRARFGTLFEDWPTSDVETLATLLTRLNAVLTGTDGH